MTNSNVFSFGETRLRSDLALGEEIVRELHHEKKINIDDLIAKSKNSLALRNHLNGYPMFSKSCDILLSLIGGTWQSGGDKPLVLIAMDHAVQSGIEFYKQYQGNSAQVQSVLATSLADKLVELASFKTIGVMKDGKTSSWDIREQSFEAWASELNDGKYFVASKRIPTQPEVSGLKVRLLTMTLDDRHLGMVMHGRF